MDYYSLLGVNRNASQDEIKKAYKKACMKHHPDRGGSESEFKRVNEAYDVLSDPQKRQIHDMGGDPNQQHRGGFGGFHQGPFEFRFGDRFEDVFGGFGFGGQRQRRNKTVNISISITLEDVLAGKTIHAEIAMPGNKTKLITIEIPKGIDHGQQIRYQGMGDDSIQGIPPGDLIVTIMIQPNTNFARQGDNLICERNISVWDCILGTTITIVTIDGKNLNINIPAGTQPETVMSCKSEGLPNFRSHLRGNLLIRIKTKIPRNLSEEARLKITEIKNMV